MKNFYASLKGIAVLGLVMCWGVGVGQQLSFAWAKKLGGYATGTSFTDKSYTTVVDSAGNVYTAGFFFSNGNAVDFDPGPGIFNLPGSQYTTIFISKLDANGNFVWAKQIGSSGDETVTSMTLDKAGQILITGIFDNQTDFDPGPGTEYLYSNGDFDVFIEKIDTSGNFIWAKSIGSTDPEPDSHIATDTAGNVYISGSFTATIDFDPGFGMYNLYTHNFPGRHNADAYILKLNAAGNFMWAYSFGDFYDDYITAITVDNDGNVYAAGLLYPASHVDFDPGPGTYQLKAAPQGSAFLLKLNPAGNFAWVKAFDEYYTNYYPELWIFGLTTDQQGNVYTGGYFKQTIDFDPGPDSLKVTSKNNSADIYITKLDSAGNFVWVKTMGGSRDDVLYAIKTDTANNVYATGKFNDTVNFNPGTGVADLVSASIYTDVFFLKLDKNGNFLWAERIGGNEEDNSSGLTTDLNNNVIATGNFRGTVDFDPKSGTYNMTSSGSDDIFILKLSQQNITPLHLLTFTVKKQDNTSLLNWTTAHEINTDRFDIQRSPNGREFSTIGIVKANPAPGGTGQYSYTDNNPTTTPNSKPQTIFYRLKMLDKDGAFTYSPIRQVAINHSSLIISIYPNPAHDRISITGSNMQSVTITDLAGHIVKQQSIPNTDFASMAITSLAKGVYTVKVMSGEEVQTQKLVVR